MKRFFVGGVLLMTGLTGCQTTYGIDTPDAQLAKQVAMRHCIVGVKEVGIEQKVSSETTHVYSITPREGDWLAADMSSQGIRGRTVRGNIYFNKTTGQYACGTKNWRAGQATKRFRTSGLLNRVKANFTADYSSLSAMEAKSVKVMGKNAVPIYKEATTEAPVVKYVTSKSQLVAYEQTNFWLHVRDVDMPDLNGWILKGKADF